MRLSGEAVPVDAENCSSFGLCEAADVCFLFDVLVPEETQIVIKKGEKVAEKKRIFPGYVLVEMIVTDESWYVVRNTPNVTGFVGSGNIPVPVSLEEFNMIKKRKMAKIQIL